MRFLIKNLLAIGVVFGHNSLIHAPPFVIIFLKRFALELGPILFSPPANTAIVDPEVVDCDSQTSRDSNEPQCAAASIPIAPPDITV